MKTCIKTSPVLRVVLLACGFSMLVGQLQAQIFRTIHSFTSLGDGGTNSDGGEPWTGLIMLSNTLYGTAHGGGEYGYGTVFAVSSDGVDFTTLHSFTPIYPAPSINGDGAFPYAGLVSSDNILYGTASDGGSGGSGTIFSVNTDGTGFTTLYSFTAVADCDNASGTGFNSDGASPNDLVLSSKTLYGTTYTGGSGGQGTVFAINIDGTGFTTLYSFTALSDSCDQGTNIDGAAPFAGLALSGNTLYGTTARGGSGGQGTVFAINADGTGFRVLYSFTALIPYYTNSQGSVHSTNSDGAGPGGRLIISGNTLYGTASYGGVAGSPDGNGTVFRVNTDGTGFTTLHRFSVSSSWDSPNSDGATPDAGLVISGKTLYGTADYGGNAGNGTVFRINTDGSDFVVLHNFTAVAPSYPYTNSDGENPLSQLFLLGSTLYGTATFGGVNPGGRGTIFSISLPIARPQLAITPAGASVILTWPTNATGFTLQSTTNLGSSAVWTTNSPAPVVVNGQNTVTNPISGTQQFYRLVQ